MKSADEQVSRNEWLEIVKRSCIASAVVGGLFLVLLLCAIFMTSGDGSAPMFTHTMLALADMPKKWLGLSGTGLAFSAPLAWAAIVGMASLVLQSLWMIISDKNV